MCIILNGNKCYGGKEAQSVGIVSSRGWDSHLNMVIREGKLEKETSS